MESKIKEESGFWLVNVTITNFTLMDRIRILLGSTLEIHSTIYLDKEVDVVKPTISRTYIEPIFKRKEVNTGYTEPVEETEQT